MNLKILTPKTRQIEKSVSKVFLPGTSGSFEVLRNHAPLISSLTGGEVRWENESDGSQESFGISSGFVEVKDNIITVAAEQ